MRFWALPMLLVVTCIVVAIGAEEWRLLLRYDRVWLLEGETWRLVSGHVTHLGWRHVLLNIAGLVLIWFLVGSCFDGVGWWIVIASSVIAINVGLWVFDPLLIWYVGLSGVLHGLLAAGVSVRLLAAPDGESLLLATLLLVKLGWEQFNGPAPGSEFTAGGPVVVNAHLYGALGGIAGALLTRIRWGGKE